MRSNPKFTVKALGSYKQLPGCPEYVHTSMSKEEISRLLENRTQNIDNILLNILGYRSNFQTIDLFPISKWILISCLGYFVGNEFINYESLNDNQFIANNSLTNTIAKLGQYSLEVYIVHWFVIYGLQN